MISIITAIHNQLPMNRLFYEKLVRYTRNKFELIIIDNASDDGSREFFESKGAVVIRNDANYAYAHCQNQGIAVAKFNILAFFNNDIIVSDGWDEKVFAIMNNKGFDIVTCAANDRMESLHVTGMMHKRWMRSRNPLLFFFGQRLFSLRLMHRFMYGNWDHFTKERFNQFGDRSSDGISGSNVIMTRSSLDKIGLWDETIQGADFDIFLRTKKRQLEKGDIKPIQVLLGVYFHHYSRMTVRSKPRSFENQHKLINLLDKWDKQEAQKMLEGTGLMI